MSEIAKRVTIENLDYRMLKFTLGLYKKSLLSRKAVDEVIDDVQTFLSEDFICFLQTLFEDEIKPITSAEVYFKIQFILESSKNLFNKFSTEKKRFDLYEEEGLFVPPENYLIGKIPYYDPTQNRVVPKDVYGCFVPLQKTLKLFLQKPGIFEQLFNYTKQLFSSDPNILCNVVHGSIYKKYVSNHTDKICFPLFGHYDEFEVGATLGSHSGEQKLGESP